jgi:hypothetical protein
VRIVPAQQPGTTPAQGGQALLEQLSRIRVADPAGTPPASRDGQAPAPGDVIVTVEAGRETRVVHDGVESPRHRVISVDPSTGAVTTVTTNDPVPRESIANIVTGRVVDESGEPVEGLVVDALRITNVSGMRGLQTSSLARQTDDRGQFRLFGIAPGSYYLEARGDANASTRYAGSFYPGRASLADAEPIVIEKGSELTGLDMVFRPSRPEPLRVSGTVVDAAGQAKLVGDVGMLLRHGAGLTGLGFDSRIEADGSFTIPNVPPGDYVLYAVGKGTSGERELGVTNVAVAANVGPVLIGTGRGTRMTGHVTFEGGLPAATPAKFGLAVVPGDPAYAQMVTVYDGGFVGRDGNFEMTGLVGPGRLILAGAPEGWWIKSVLIGGRDIGTSPIPFGTAHLADVTVVVADGGARLTVPLGSDPNSRVQSIAVFPVDQNYWFVGSSRIRLLSRALTGRIGVTLPPGEYWVTTVETSYADEAFGTWGAESLGTLAARAKRATLVAGQTTVVEMDFGPN